MHLPGKPAADYDPSPERVSLSGLRWGLSKCVFTRLERDPDTSGPGEHSMRQGSKHSTSSLNTSVLPSLLGRHKLGGHLLSRCLSSFPFRNRENHLEAGLGANVWLYYGWVLKLGLQAESQKDQVQRSCVLEKAGRGMKATDSVLYGQSFFSH